MRHSVYVLDWRSSGGRLYVGVSRSLRNRLAQHKNGPQASPTRRAWKKYGKPRCWILASGLSFDEALEFERSAIQGLQTLRPHGYNIMPGGDAMDASVEQLSEWGRKGSATITHEARSRGALRRWASSTPEERSDRMRRVQAKVAPERRSEIARAREAAKTPDQKRDIARKLSAAVSKLTFAQRSAASKKAFANKTPEQLADFMRKGQAVLAAKTPPERRRIALKREAAKTLEQRTAEKKKGWVTRKSKLI